jgi:bifunctional ADP-heptose synthase (sugar kinase/adenylyltransferase)
MNAFPAEAISHSRVLVVGDVMLDRYWFGEVERISPEAPVPVVRVARREDRLGGAANVARNVAALGGHVTLVGVLGEDEAGDSVRRLSAEAGIQAELVADPSLHTTLKMRVLGRQQQLLRVDFEQHPAQAALDNVDAAFARHLANHDIVVLSDYAKGVLARVESLIALARNAGVPVLVDPKGHDYTRYRGAALVTDRAQRLRADLDLEALLVTRSEQGMTLFTDAGRDHIDAQAHEVFDVSGAGDTVLATLAVSRAIDLPWVDAMGWANKAGGIAVGKLGTSIVTAAELAGELS